MRSGPSYQIRKEPFWAHLSPWAVMGAVLLLVLMSGGFTLATIRQLNGHTTSLLTEKGAALIRSFEAGARTGMKGLMGMQRGRFRLQHLLMETARQEDIAYLLVTDTAGKILAHSDPEKIGRPYGGDLDWQAAALSTQVAWRIQTGVTDRDIFEVYRRYSPSLPPHPGPHGHGRDPKGLFPEAGPAAATPHIGPPEQGVIFIGLEMASAVAARRIGVRQALLTSALMMLVGLGALGSLFLAQANRATRSALSQAQAFSEHLLAHLPLGLVALDGQNRVMAYNRAARQLTGIEAGRAMGNPAQKLFAAPFQAVLAQTPPLRQEIQTSGPGGEPVTLALFMSDLPAVEGGEKGRLLLLQDLTQVKLLQQEVHKQERLAAVGRLAAGVAHEVRNPLSSIKGFALYFKERQGASARDRDTAQIMVQEVDRINRVIGQLLDLARPEKIEIRPLAPEPLVRDSLRMVTDQAHRQGVRVEFNVAGELPFVAVDPDKIKQVLLNVLINALEAMESGGRLTVSLAPAQGGQAVGITIGDSGPGMEESQLDRIYDPYYTTKPGGTGLGLAIVAKILEAHKAPLKVASEPGAGTRVTLRLPAASRESSAFQEQPL